MGFLLLVNEVKIITNIHGLGKYTVLGEFTMVSKPIRLILVDWFVFHFQCLLQLYWALRCFNAVEQKLKHDICAKSQSLNLTMVLDTSSLHPDSNYC